jgi:hypothetical protein
MHRGVWLGATWRVSLKRPESGHYAARPPCPLGENTQWEDGTIGAGPELGQHLRAPSDSALGPQAHDSPRHPESTGGSAAFAAPTRRRAGGDATAASTGVPTRTHVPARATPPRYCVGSPERKHTGRVERRLEVADGGAVERIRHVPSRDRGGPTSAAPGTCDGLADGDIG